MSRIALVRSIADQIKAQHTQQGKEEILIRYERESLFKRIISYAYNPMINFNMQDYTPKHYGKPDGMGISKFMHIPEDIFQGKFTQEEAEFACELALTHMNNQESNLFLGMLKKDLDLGLSIETINKVWYNLIPEYPVQHLSEFSEELVSTYEWPCVAQRLINGLRVNIIVRGNSVEFRNKQGKTLHNFDSFIEQFSNLAQNGATVFDGHAVVVDDDMNVVATEDSIVLTAKSENIKFLLWDAIRYDGFVQGEDSRIGYNWRFNGLEHMMFLAVDKNSQPCYGIPEHQIVDSIEHARKYAVQLDSDIVVKNFSGTWKNGITLNEMIIRK
jgi:hypothetical protein